MKGRITSNAGKLPQRLSERPVYIVGLFIVIYTAYFSYFTVLEHQTFQTTAYDLGIYMQSLWNTVNGNGLFYTSLWEGSRFARHFEPILFFIVPLYAILPKAETLLVLQSFVLALGALPVYWLAKDELGSKVGVVFAGLYLLSPALHGVNSFDFHGSALAIPILLFSFYMFKKKRYKWGIALAVLAMMCKENVALVVIFMGFYWLWMARKGTAKRLNLRSLPREPDVVYPLCLSIIAVIWFVMAVNVIIPHFSLTGEYHFGFGRYGYGNIFGNLFIDLANKLWYLFYLFGPLLFTSLLNPAALLIGLPILAQNLLAINDNMYSIVFQYPSLLIPWLFIASIYGLKWLSTVQGKSIEAIRMKFLYLLVLASVVMALLVSPSPIALNYDMPRLTSHHTTLQQAISLIPEDASVYAQNDLFPHVCHRIHAYSHTAKPGLDFFEFYGGNYDYILVDSTSAHAILRLGSEESLERLEREYGIYAQGDGVYLYKKGYGGEPLILDEK